MSRQLNEPILEYGIRNTYFFNGRLLTADDLKTDQQASRQQHWRLGRAVGDGVIDGLEVSLLPLSPTNAPPVVGITKGLALNRKGQVLSLPGDDQVTLTRRTENLPLEAGLFGECERTTSGFTNLTDGIYLLAIAPASGFQEKAPMRSVEPNAAVVGCGSKYAVEGVQFRLFPLDFGNMTAISQATRTLLQNLMGLTDDPSLSKLRNILAHLCFSTEETATGRRDPFQRLSAAETSLDYGLAATLRTLGQLADCDVPLALIYWKRRGVQFVDNWAVRRLARRVPDFEGLPIIYSYGYERFLQFQHHLRELAEPAAGLATIRAQDYFRYLPSVAYFPVTGARSPRGLHPVNFLRDFSTGSAGQMSVEVFGTLLQDSFTCSDVDLQTGPTFQIYQVRENTSAVEARVSTQLYQVFVSRDLNGPLAQDGVAQAFADAWDSYHGLIKRRVFLPPGTDEAKIAAQIGITSAIRDVLDIANRQHAIAAARALDAAAALGAFRALYDIQRELATYLQSRIPGVTETQDRERFGQELSRLLEAASIAGQPGLLRAIRTNNLPGAVNAQNVINAFVGAWSGEGVAVGPFGSVWQQGQPLVPGQTAPSPQRFLVNNSTDKRLRIQLEAAATAPHGTWARSTTIEDEDGQEISFVDLESGATTSVIVQVRAPSDAQIGDNATVTLTTIVAPPTNRRSQSSATLSIVRDGGGVVTSSITFDGPVIMPAFDPDNAAHDSTLTYGYNLSYTAPPGSPPATFRLIVRLTSAAVSDWAVRILDLSGSTTNPSPGEFRREFNLTPGSLSLVSVIIRTPTATSTSDRTASFSVRVESVSLSPSLGADHPQTFNIRVRANA